MDSLRLAVLPDQDPEAIHRCRAQASAMMRHMESGLRALQRTQAMREKDEAAMHPGAMDRTGYWFREVSTPARGEGPGPQPAAASEAEEVSRPADLAIALGESRTEAEQYVAIYPDRAARIRAYGGLPPRLDFGPPAPKIVAELVNGASPSLQALDHHPRALSRPDP